MFYDAHLHKPFKEKGGFLVALQGKPKFNDTLNNDEVLKFTKAHKNYLAFYYVSSDEILVKISHKFLKYHPRREKYTKYEVINSIAKSKPKCVMIDTLNEPYWNAYDYWEVARKFPEIYFVFAHSGGYLINDFIKICHFQKNVWIDFALTHTTLAKFNDKNGLLYIQNAINYALHSDFRKRILLGSDYPFFSQNAVFDYYKNHKKLLNANFENLFGIIHAK